MAAKSKSSKMLRATQTSAVAVSDSETLLVKVGDRVLSDHELVRGREELFEPAEPRPDIESAPPKKRKAKKASR